MSSPTPDHRNRTPRFATRIVHAGDPTDRPRTAVPPIHTSTVVELAVSEPDYDDIVYPRLNNTPNHDVLARKLADLEGGEDALVTASGMAAITTTLLHVLRGGGHLLVQGCLYGGTHHFVHHALSDFGIRVDVLPDDPATWPSLVRPETRAVYVESMTNPLLTIVDHVSVVEFARENGILSIVDNTFATPVAFPAIAFGYDLAVHSATKYLNGHSDLCAGVVVGSGERLRALRGFANLLGCSLDPRACSLLHRGIRTLALRFRQQSATAQRLAEFLVDHDAVERVHYPGLDTHPDHARARDFFGPHCGGVLSFELADDSMAAATRLIEGLGIALHAPSLGGPETLVVRPAATSHASLSPAERHALGIGDGLVRVSVGLEDAEDLVVDFGRALRAVTEPV